VKELVIKCPFCGDHPRGSHYHLHINPQKGVFFCFYCGRGGTLDYLTSRVPSIKHLINLPRSDRRPSQQVFSFFPLLQGGRESPYIRQIFSYLLKRLTAAHIEEYGVSVSPQLPHRVVFPHDRGFDYFWAARATVSMRPKWLFPPKRLTAASPSSAVWGIDRIRDGEEIWIAEGIFDAISVKGVAIFGKTPHPIQIRQILSKAPRRIVIAFDRDAVDSSEKLQRQLRGLVPTSIILPPNKHKDFGELLPEGFR